MHSGRITKQEKEQRLRQILGFVFNFRYATREQLLMFGRLVLKLSSPRWLIDDAVRRGYLVKYNEPSFGIKIYYLGQAGKRLLLKYDFLVEYYHFEQRHAGPATFVHHNMVAETYFLLMKSLLIKEWSCEWVLRLNKSKRDKIPDGLIVLADGLKIALEVETSSKILSAWKTVVKLYEYDVDRISRYHGILVVACSKTNLEMIKSKLDILDEEFCSRAFILSELDMLKQGTCFYHDEIMPLEEALKSIGRERQNHG